MESINFTKEILDKRSMQLLERIKCNIENLIDANINKEYINPINYFIDNIENKEYYSETESRKILTTIDCMLNMFRENLDKGFEPRKLSSNIDEESENLKFQEILEATILASKNEFEEKKLKYYGFLLSNILFKNELNQDECNRLIRLATKLSYCKIKLINLYFISQTIQVPILKREDYTKNRIDNYRILGVLQDTLEMVQMGLLNGSGKIILDVVQINPSKIRVQGIGMLIYNLMGLNKMPYDEMEDLLDILSMK